MKVIKLNRKYKLFHNGFTHALVGSSSDPAATKVQAYLTRIYGYHGYSHRGAWYATFGSKKVTLTIQGTKNRTYKGKPYYIAVRSEADITACLLVAAG